MSVNVFVRGQTTAAKDNTSPIGNVIVTSGRTDVPEELVHRASRLHNGVQKYVSELAERGVLHLDVKPDQGTGVCGGVVQQPGDYGQRKAIDTIIVVWSDLVLSDEERKELEARISDAYATFARFVDENRDWRTRREGPVILPAFTSIEDPLFSWFEQRQSNRVQEFESKSQVIQEKLLSAKAMADEGRVKGAMDDLTQAGEAAINEVLPDNSSKLRFVLEEAKNDLIKYIDQEREKIIALVGCRIKDESSKIIDRVDGCLSRMEDDDLLALPNQTKEEILAFGKSVAKELPEHLFERSEDRRKVDDLCEGEVERIRGFLDAALKVESERRLCAKRVMALDDAAGALKQILASPLLRLAPQIQKDLELDLCWVDRRKQKPSRRSFSQWCRRLTCTWR